ncbi:MAG: phosphonoacetaldehyde reductase [Oscillibacter sp.]|nr:phosphonoacetaldehyde reductase [Oscillibacter sp.]
MQQTFFIGEEAINQFLPIMRQYAPKHILLVRGKKSYVSCGAKEKMDSFFSLLGCRVTEFYDFEENPKREDLEKGLSLVEGHDISVIVAVGGGSVLDMAKLLRFFYSYSGDFTGNSFQKEREPIPLVVFPTTAGTGSEATHFAVLYENKVKYSVEHDAMLSDVALVYPPFTYKNPPYLTACTGFDALAQAIESFWNVNANEESLAYAKRAIGLLWSNLPLVVNSPTPESRDKVSEGAYWAGRAINITKTTAPHAFSYPFTSYYGYPHGHAVALLFPYIAEYNLSHAAEKNRELYFLLNIRCAAETEKIFLDYVAEIGLSGDINEVDEDVILDHVNMKRLGNNPVLVNREIAIRFLKKLKSNHEV